MAAGPKPNVSITDVGGSSYAELVDDELNAQRALKASLEQRGISVITTSGALVTLLFGFAALTTATKAQTFVALPTPTRALVVIALGLFAVAVILALSTNAPLPHRGVADKALERVVEPPVWNSPDPILAARRVTEVKVTAAISLHRLTIARPMRSRCPLSRRRPTPRRDTSGCLRSKM